MIEVWFDKNGKGYRVPVELMDRIRDAQQTIEFYGDSSNYEIKHPTGVTTMQLEDREDYSRYGKRARKFLEKYKQDG